MRSGSAPIARDCTRTKKTRAAQSERCALLSGSLLALVPAFVDESRDSDIFYDLRAFSFFARKAVFSLAFSPRARQRSCSDCRIASQLDWIIVGHLEKNEGLGGGEMQRTVDEG